MSFRIPTSAISHAVYRHNDGVERMENACSKLRPEVKQVIRKTQQDNPPLTRLSAREVGEAVRAEYGDEKEGRFHCEICDVWVKNLKAHARRSTEHIARIEIDALAEGGWVVVDAYQIKYNLSSCYDGKGDQYFNGGVVGLVADLGTDVAKIGPTMHSWSNRVNHGGLYMKMDQSYIMEIIEFMRKERAPNDRHSHLGPDAREELVHRIKDYANGGDEYTIMKLGAL